LSGPETVSARPVLPLPPEGAFLVVDKPRGPSSHQVTAWVRDLLRVDRAGHAGTLDPGVSGVLVMAVGKALRLLPLLLTFPKRYVAVVTLHGSVPPATVERVLKEFQGPIYQTPPVRSAVRRERRVRTVHRLTLVERGGRELLLEVQADSGTYIRTLAVDLGEALGCGANMTELRRVSTGPFSEKEAVTLAALADMVARSDEGRPEDLQRALRPPRTVWARFPQVVVKDSAVDALAHGADLAAQGVLKVTHPFPAKATVVLVTRKDELVGLGESLVSSEELSHRRSGWVVDAHQVLMEPGRYPARSSTRPPSRPGAPSDPPLAPEGSPGAPGSRP
jgi:H/ACA ribonucleoprotein complex subunit 4